MVYVIIVNFKSDLTKFKSFFCYLFCIKIINFNYLKKIVY